MKVEEVLEFLRRHKWGVVATLSSEGVPQSAVVGVAFSDRFEIVFDTIESSRKCQNLRAHAPASMVVGWDSGITVQLEGLADEPKGEDLERLKAVYFAAFPDGKDRLSWPGLTYIRLRPAWARYSDFNPPGRVVEFQLPI